MTDAAARSPQSGWLDRLLSFPGVILFWIAYGIAHTILRQNISHTLTLDDSRASELVQNFAPGYQVRQPPLYEWLLWCSQQLLGSGLASHQLVRYSLIAALGIATFGAVRAATKHDRWAALASLSLVFSYPVGWTFHEWATQTILLCIACMATLHGAILFFERGGMREAVLLGLAMALGFYAKFSYPLFLAALLLASLSIEETRRKLANPLLLISCTIVLVLLSPYILWLLKVQGNVATEISGHLIKSRRSHLSRAGTGLLLLAKSLAIFLLPWILFVAMLAPPAFLRRANWTSEAGVIERLVLRAMIVASILAAIGIVAVGATNIAERYMHPVLIVAPVYVFARIVRLADKDQFVRQAAVFAVGAALVIFSIRFIAATDNSITRNASRGLFAPYEQLAKELRQRGIANGTMVTMEVRDAGNLRAFIPELRVIARDSLRAERPPAVTGSTSSCYFLMTSRERDRDKELEAAIARDNLKPETVTATPPKSLLFATRSESWTLVRLPPPSPVCR
jgi:hypothetical protein